MWLLGKNRKDICVCLISFFVLYRWGAFLFPFKWCHDCKGNAFVDCSDGKLAKSGLGLNSILQDDRTCSHRVGFIRDCLQNLEVKRTEWPACSPELNPTEPLWDQPGHAVHARVTSTTALADIHTLTSAAQPTKASSLQMWK